jgi:hypothetical protein
MMKLENKAVRFTVQAENGIVIRRLATTNFELSRGRGGRTAAPELLDTSSHFGRRRSDKFLNGERAEMEPARTWCTDRGQDVLTRGSCVMLSVWRAEVKTYGAYAYWHHVVLHVEYLLNGQHTHVEGEILQQP